jgi:hypothetical protein
MDRQWQHHTSSSLPQTQAAPSGAPGSFGRSFREGNWVLLGFQGNWLATWVEDDMGLFLMWLDMAESLETLLGAMGKRNIGYKTREREQEIKAPISDAVPHFM